MTTCASRVTALLLTLFCIAHVSGCGASESSVAGTYELDKEAVRAAAKAEMEKQAAAEDDDDMAAFGATMMLGMIEQMSMTLTLNEDGTAAAVMTMTGETENATGTWSLDGGNISITLAAEGEQPDTATGTVEGDTITMASTGDDDMPFNLVFRKKQT